jgi:predicted dehydrogenase
MKRRHFLYSSSAALLAAQNIQSAAPDARVRVGVIGHTGRGNYGHGLDTMWLNLPETEIAAVADADPKGLAAAQKKLSLDKGFADYREMLRETKPEIVSIATRHLDQHRDMVLASIDAGAKGIYMEKTFCRDLSEADEIVTACEKHGVKLALAHRNRYHPVLPVLVNLIKEGLIGQVLEYRARGKEDRRGGAEDAWVLGSHLVNLLCYFGGNPVSCSAEVLQNGKPISKSDVYNGAEGIGPMAGNEIHARYRMTNGLAATFDSIQNAGLKVHGFGLQIIGTAGIIQLRIDEEPLASVMLGNPFTPSKETRSWQPITTGGVNKPEPIVGLGKEVAGHLLAGKDLIQAIKENRAPLCSAEDGRMTLEMISALFESHRLSGQAVPLPLKTRVNPLTLLS